MSKINIDWLTLAIKYQKQIKRFKEKKKRSSFSCERIANDYVHQSKAEAQFKQQPQRPAA